jgi:hypothetical protein
MESVPETKNFHTLTWLPAQEDSVESLQVPNTSDVVVYDFLLYYVTEKWEEESIKTGFSCAFKQNPAFQLQTPLICELVGLRTEQTIRQDPETEASFV